MNKTLAVKMLKRARVLIENYEYEFVCNALTGLPASRDLPREMLPYYETTKSELLWWIKLQLRGASSFVSYYHNMDIETKRMNAELRVEWITNMIKAILLNEPMDTYPIDSLKF